LFYRDGSGHYLPPFGGRFFISYYLEYVARTSSILLYFQEKNPEFPGDFIIVILTALSYRSWLSQALRLSQFAISFHKTISFGMKKGLRTLPVPDNRPATIQ